MGHSKKENPEKLATLCTQDEEKQNKNTTQYVLDTTKCKQTQKTQIRHAPSYKQLEVYYKRKVCLNLCKIDKSNLLQDQQ
jgi:hypothetical protein